MSLTIICISVSLIINCTIIPQMIVYIIIPNYNLSGDIITNCNLYIDVSNYNYFMSIIIIYMMSVIIICTHISLILIYILMSIIINLAVIWLNVIYLLSLFIIYTLIWQDFLLENYEEPSAVTFVQFLEEVNRPRKVKSSFLLLFW